MFSAQRNSLVFCGQITVASDNSFPCVTDLIVILNVSHSVNSCGYWIDTGSQGLLTFVLRNWAVMAFSKQINQSLSVYTLFIEHLLWMRHWVDHAEGIWKNKEGSCFKEVIMYLGRWGINKQKSQMVHNLSSINIKEMPQVVKNS